LNSFLRAPALFVALLIWVSPLWAEQKDAVPESADQSEALLRKRQQEMLDMHDLMHRIRDAKDKNERARLMDEHRMMLKRSWQEMRDQRKLLMKKRMGDSRRHRDSGTDSSTGEFSPD
jgi:hypothetical protein